MSQLLVCLRYETQLWTLLKVIARRDPNLIELDEPSESRPEASALLSCTEARQDGFGFVRLALSHEGKNPGDIPQAISVPTHLVAWISEETKHQAPGFFADWRAAT